MKKIKTYLKTTNKVVLMFAILSFIVSLVSCTVEEVEPVNTNIVSKPQVFDEQLSQRDSIPNTGKPTDSIPSEGEIIPPPIKK